MLPRTLSTLLLSLPPTPAYNIDVKFGPNAPTHSLEFDDSSDLYHIASQFVRDNDVRHLGGPGTPFGDCQPRNQSCVALFLASYMSEQLAGGTTSSKSGPELQRISAPLHSVPSANLNRFQQYFWNEPKPYQIDKWHHYLDIYDRYLSPLFGKSPTILEIGVWLCGAWSCPLREGGDS